MDKDKLITLEEAAAIKVCGLQFSYGILRRAYKTGHLMARKIGPVHTIYTKIKWIEQWIDSPEGTGGQGLPSDGKDVVAVQGGMDSPSPPVLPAPKRGRGRPPKKLA